MKGIDYAWGSKPYDEFVRQGVKFVMRYISHDPSKDLTNAEKAALLKRGIKVGLVFETTTGRALSDRAGGITDARYAKARADALGMKDAPIYFAVDFDAKDIHKPAIHRYLQGAVSVLGHDRVGVYAGYHVIKYVYEHGSCKWLWQTYAWSGGQLHPATHIHQYRNGIRIGGLSADLNDSKTVDFGVYPRPIKPIPTPKPKPVPAPPAGAISFPKDDTFWTWLRWKTGTGEFESYGKSNKIVRPNVPQRIPSAWWFALKKFVAKQPS